MKVWELNTTDLHFSPFILPEDGKKDFFIQFMEDINDDLTPRKKMWKPLVILKSEQRIDSDFIDLYDTGAIIVNSKGKDLLTSLSLLDEDSYELLPFLNDEDEYYLFNLLRFTDALDKDISVYEEFMPGKISNIELLAFDYNKIAHVPVFKVPELPYSIFITQTFRTYYDEMNLKGLNFEDNLIYVD
ncbi:MAG: hypothetical protein LBV74_16325 [Tannerella sp.]|jgi:hypothetical protein|nr:hypothetical protein [Tannerella sp.]